MSALVSILRWSARFAGLLVAGGFILLVAGEFAQSPKISGMGIILLTCTCAGMLGAWRWELAGAIFSLAALTTFTLLIRIRHHAILFVFASPGILFLADWVVRRRLKLRPDIRP